MVLHHVVPHSHHTHDGDHHEIAHSEPRTPSPSHTHHHHEHKHDHHNGHDHHGHDLAIDLNSLLDGLFGHHHGQTHLCHEEGAFIQLEQVDFSSQKVSKNSAYVVCTVYIRFISETLTAPAQRDLDSYHDPFLRQCSLRGPPSLV